MSASPLEDLAPWRQQVEDALRAQLRSFVDSDGTPPPPRLVTAMAHSLLAGGKRLRPLLVLAAAQAVHPNDDDDAALFARAMPSALAVEYLHTYSLIHDDLPSLDDDDLRRGRPTLHKAFDEGTAVLAGDALLTDAFAQLASSAHNAAAQVRELALAAGSAGMVGGQHDDLRAEGTSPTLETLASIHRRKTGRLFMACAAIGGLCAGGAAAVVDDLRRYGAHFGLAFQIADDVLDVTGDIDKGGKVRGRDTKHDKATFVRLLGVEGASQRAQAEAEAAIAIARAHGSRLLEALAHFAATRTH